MIQEIVDPHSGAIIFREDDETLSRKELEKKVSELERQMIILSERLKKLEDSK